MVTYYMGDWAAKGLGYYDTGRWRPHETEIRDPFFDADHISY